jgi:hypothetical protein
MAPAETGKNPLTRVENSAGVSHFMKCETLCLGYMGTDTLSSRSRMGCLKELLSGSYLMLALLHHLR